IRVAEVAKQRRKQVPQTRQFRPKTPLAGQLNADDRFLSAIGDPDRVVTRPSGHPVHEDAVARNRVLGYVAEREWGSRTAPVVESHGVVQPAIVTRRDAQWVEVRAGRRESLFA